MKRYLFVLLALLLLLCSCSNGTPSNEQITSEGASEVFGASSAETDSTDASETDMKEAKPTEIWYSTGELSHYEFRKSPDGYLVETLKSYYDTSWETLSSITVSVKKDDKLLYSSSERFDETGKRTGSSHRTYVDGVEVEAVSTSYIGEFTSCRVFRNGKSAEEYLTKKGALIRTILTYGDTQTTTHYLDGKVNHIEKRYPTENSEDGYDYYTYATYDGEMNLLSLNYGRKSEHKLDDGRIVSLHLGDPSDVQYVIMYVDYKQIAIFHRDAAAKITDFVEIAGGYSEADVEKTYKKYMEKVEAEYEITSKWYDYYQYGN
ncbi:MAG: hypothetical protein IKK70_01725 [Clostridia bacterium]|nr:hypothetical protein [Clostridia bacterium]